MNNLSLGDNLKPLFNDLELLQLIAEAKENIAAGETISHREVKRLLDFKESFENE